MSKQVLIEEAFDTYASDAKPLERQRAFSVLLTLKALPKLAADRRVEQGIAQWGAVLFANTTEKESDELRLLAVVELVRALQVLKTGGVAEQIKTLLQTGLQHALPPSRLLKEADARLYLAKACAYGASEWLPAYVAQAIAEEDTGEKARSEFLGILFTHVQSLASGLQFLSAAFASLSFATESPGDSMAKRLVRTLVALRPVLLASLLPTGENVGQAFAHCLRMALNAAGQPKDKKSQLDLTREVAFTVHDLVRTRFSLATEAQTFSVLKVCRRFFSQISWPSELQPAMICLIQDLTEALLVLGRQDIPQQALLEQLELVCGSKDKAKAVAKQLAEQHTELPERIRDWLRRGRLTQQHANSEVLQASLLESNDLAVGCALLEARKLLQAEDSLRYVLGVVEIYEPALLRQANSYLQQVKASVAAFEEVATRRGIYLLGQEGELLAFAPKFFEPLRALKSQQVTIRRPAIVRRFGQHGQLHVLMKGLVE